MRCVALTIVVLASLVALTGASVVNVPCNGGTCSFTAIVSAAANLTNGGTLTLAAGTFTGPCGNGAIFAGNATVVGAVAQGVTTTFIDCQGSGQGFVFPSQSAACVENIAFRYTRGGPAISGNLLSVTNCHFNYIYGGAVVGAFISVDYSTFVTVNSTSPGACVSAAVEATVANTVFQQCRAVGLSGGAIFAGVSATAINSTFNFNQAMMGAAIFTYGDLMLTNTQFSTNYNTSVYANYSMMEDCTFQGNYGYYGGAAYVLTADIYSSTFYSNTAFYHGGAVNTHGSTYIYQSIFTLNTAYAGPGGAVAQTYVGETLTVYNCNFQNNYAADNGGALHIRGEGIVDVSNFLSNTAYYYGGAIDSMGPLTVEGTGITNGQAIYGAGISALEFLNITNSPLNSNHGTYGGALFLVQSALITGCSINGNNAYSGAVLYASCNAGYYGDIDAAVGAPHGPSYPSYTSTLPPLDCKVKFQSCVFSVNAAASAGSIATINGSMVSLELGSIQGAGTPITQFELLRGDLVVGVIPKVQLQYNGLNFMTCENGTRFEMSSGVMVALQNANVAMNCASCGCCNRPPASSLVQLISPVCYLYPHQSCTYTCATGYYSNNQHLTCLSPPGNFTPAVPCIPVACPTPPLPAHATYVNGTCVNNGAYGSSCQFACVPGYVPTTNYIGYCTSSNSYTGQYIVCAIPGPPSPQTTTSSFYSTTGWASTTGFSVNTGGHHTLGVVLGLMGAFLAIVLIGVAYNRYRASAGGMGGTSGERQRIINA